MYKNMLSLKRKCKNEFDGKSIVHILNTDIIIKSRSKIKNEILN